MYQSEKNFLEKIASHIPGLKGYREKEDRRETDKRLRDYMAAELDKNRKALEVLKRTLLGQGELDVIDDLDRVTHTLQKAADSIRFASYGYAGLFDQVKIQDAELDKLYEYDGELLGLVKAFGERSAAVPAAAEIGKALVELETASEELNSKIDGRKQIFNIPS